MKQSGMTILIMLTLTLCHAGAQIVLEPESVGHVGSVEKHCHWITWYGYHGSVYGGHSWELDPRIGVGQAMW